MTTPFAIKRLQNGAKFSTVQIVVNIDWNDQTKGCSETTLTVNTQSYLCAKFHISNHEGYYQKGQCVDRKFMVSLWYYSESMDIGIKCNCQAALDEMLVPN